MNPYVRSLIEVLRRGTTDECTHTGSMRERDLNEHEIWCLAMEIGWVERPGILPMVSYDVAAEATGKAKSSVAWWVYMGKVNGDAAKKKVSLSSLNAYLGKSGMGNETRA